MYINIYNKMTSHEIFEKKQDYELYSQTIQLSNQDERINKLVSIKDGNKSYPDTVSIKSNLYPAIDHIYDMTLLSFTFSNAFHRIVEGVNDTLNLYFFQPRDDTALTDFVIYRLSLTIPEGNYTASTIEIALNDAFHDLDPVNPYSLPIVYNGTFHGTLPPAFTVDTNNLAFSPIIITSHSSVVNSGHTLITFDLRKSMYMYFFHDGVPAQYGINGGIKLGLDVGTDLQVFPNGRTNPLAEILGYRFENNKYYALNDTINVASISFRSNHYYNVEFKNTELHFASNAIGNMAEKNPSINSINKDNIIYTHHVVDGVASSINYVNPNPDVNRIKCKPFSKLSELDIELLDSNFEKIKNNQNDILNLVLNVRTLKNLR